MEEWIIKLVRIKVSWSAFFQILSETAQTLRPGFIKACLVMAGGSLGALCRYSVALMAGRYLGARFPWGTLLVNLTGCFLIGVSFALVERTSLLSPSARLFFMTGFLGALTTFSTYALETVNAVRGGITLISVMNFLVNNAAGLGLVILGIWMVRLIHA